MLLRVGLMSLNQCSSWISDLGGGVTLVPAPAGRSGMALSDGPLALPEYSTFWVLGPAMPSVDRPLLCWNCFTAVTVALV